VAVEIQVKQSYKKLLQVAAVMAAALVVIGLVAGVCYYLGLCCSTLGENETAITHYTQSMEKQQMVSC
jgi:hypothetical protein